MNCISGFVVTYASQLSILCYGFIICLYDPKEIKPAADNATEDTHLQSVKRSPILYAIAIWMVVNIVLMVLILLGGDTEDYVNWIELVLWVASIPALLSLKKWGLALATFTFVYTLSTSVEIIVHYLMIDPAVWPNIIRIVINVPIIIYLFKVLTDGKFK